MVLYDVWCFGAVFVSFHEEIALNLNKVAEWLPLGKELLIQFTICSPCNLCIFVIIVFVISVISHFSFEDMILVLIVPVPVHCFCFSVKIKLIKWSALYTHVQHSLAKYFRPFS